MAATWSHALRVVAVTGLFVGFNLALIVAGVALTRPADRRTDPAEPPDALALAGPAEAVDAVRDADDEAPPDHAEPPPAPPPPALPDDDTEETEGVPPTAATQPDDRPAPPPASRWTPAEMQAALLRVPEVWLQHPGVPTVPKTGRAAGKSHPLLNVLAARPDLRGLPARPPAVAQLPGPESAAVRDASVLLRKELGGLFGQDNRGNKRLSVRPEVLKYQPQVVARLMHQMLQIEAVPLRKMLLTELKRLRNPASSQALAHRAVYEPVAALRATAVRALDGRPPAEYLPVLLAAFDNPWPVAADHAADALAELAPAAAVPDLVRRLDTADSADAAGVPTVRELVRVNHARNCLLCHAQSVSGRDGVRVAAPSPTRPLPSPFSLDTYEGGGRGGSGARGSNAVFVRPDVTYLQQDFSWVLPVANPGRWPALQRFDFLVRTRPATAEDPARSDADAPQKQAVVRALRALTGKDFGPRAADWRAGLAVALKAE